MQPQTVTLAPTVGLDRDGVALAQTTGAAGNLTLSGTLASGGSVTFDVPRRVGIYSAGALSAITFTVTGTDRQGGALSEAIAGPSNSTVLTTAKFATVTQVAASAAVGTNTEVGVTAAFESKWIPLDPGKTPFAVSISGTISGTATWGVEFTNMDIRSLREHEVTRYHAHASATNKGATYGEQTAAQGPATAMRFVISSWTSGTLIGTICQAG